MVKEFIPYEQALALKELGFDEPCFSIYKTSGELIFTEFYEYNKLQKYSEKSHIGSDWLSLKCYAPLYQQAFRWFRDKHKVSGEITSSFYSEGEENEWEFNIYQLDKEDEEYNTLPIFKSYEEAELECLKKLIEIVKNNGEVNL